MIAPHQGEIIYGALARLGGLALVLVTVAFQRRGEMHWTELVFLGLCIALQETFLRLPSLRRYRNAMLVAYSLLPLALIGARANEIMQYRGEFVPLILHTPLPLVFVSIQIMVLYLREAPRLTSVVLVLALFSTVIGLRRNLGDATWPWLAAICTCTAAYLALQHPGTMLAQLVHSLAGRPTTQTQGARPASVLRPAFALALPLAIVSTVALALALFVGLPRPDLRGGDEIIAAVTPPGAPPLPQAPPDHAPGTNPGGPVNTGDASISGLSNGVNLGVFGRIQLDNRPALSVRPLGTQTARGGAIYLRSYTFAQFDGRRWLPLSDEQATRRDIVESERRILRDGTGLGGPRWVQRSYEITLKEGAAGEKGELPLPVHPTALINVPGPLSYGHVDGSVRAPMVAPESGWVVYVTELSAGGSELASELSNSRVNTTGAHADYLKVPAELPARLQEAHGFYADLSPARGGAYGAARRIVENFREKRGPDGKKLWRYSLTERPTGRNPVVRFLDTSTERAQRAGHCEYFAAAMVLLLRCHGVPARMCAGFAARSVDDAGVYQLTFADAHAWVEVWIPPYGWMAFDPTPPAETENPGPAPTVQNPEIPDAASGAAGQAPEAAAENQPAADWFKSYGARTQDEWLSGLKDAIVAGVARASEWLDSSTAWLPDIFPRNPWLRAALLAGPPLVLCWLLLARKRKRGRKVKALLGEAGKDGRKRERGLYADLLLLLARYGHTKQASETPLEFAQRVAGTAPQHEPLPSLTRLYYGFRFGLYEDRIADFRRDLAQYAARLKASGGSATTTA